MGIVNRGILFVYTLFFGLASLGIIALGLHIVPDRVLLNEYEYIMGQWQTIAVVAVVFLLSLHLLLCSFARSRSKEIHAKDLLVLQGRQGQVSVALSAIRDIAASMAGNIRGVRSAQVKTVVQHRQEEGDFLQLDVRITVGQERNIGEISDDIRSQLGEYLTHRAGIENAEIAVSVQSIVSGVSVQKRKIK